MMKYKKRGSKGFTLLEILLVIAAIGILAAIVLVAINPNRQIAQVRNAERRSEVNTIYKALEQYLIEKQGYPAGITETEQDICINNNTTGCVNLGVLVPDYVAGIPVDPSGTSYKIGIVDGRVRVRASEAELGVNIAISGSGGTIATPTAPSDPYWNNVSLLLNFDGSNGSTTFIESSSNGFTVTAFGDAQISTTDPKFGTGALTLDGNGDYLQTPADSAFQFGTGDFTIECWVYLNSGNSNDGLFSLEASSGNKIPAVNVEAGQWRLSLTTGVTEFTQGTAITGVWQHLALIRNGTDVKLFINGTQLGATRTNSTNYTTNKLSIGYYFSSSFAINARIDEFRVTKGVARYTANFTPPTEPFPTQ
jgi:prepilin-type N-terminal cleavage/methylation domain-containing protein